LLEGGGVAKEKLRGDGGSKERSVKDEKKRGNKGPEDPHKSSDRK